MMRFAPHRDHRVDPRCGAGVHVALAEIPVVGEQRANLAQRIGQFGDLVQHRLKRLLVVRRLGDIGRDHQQAPSSSFPPAYAGGTFAASARGHHRLCVVALLEPGARHGHDARLLVRQVNLIGGKRSLDRRRGRPATGLLAGQRRFGRPLRHLGIMLGLLAGMALAGPTVLAAPVQAAVVNQWLQFAPDDTVLIRAIEDTPANRCCHR